MLAVALAAVAWSDAAGPASDAINDELLVMAAGLFAVFGTGACAYAVWSALRSAGPRLKVKPVRHPQFSLTRAQVRYFVATVVNDGQATATRCWPQVELDKSLRNRTHVPAQPGVWPGLQLFRWS